jgi:hypothetical protein
VNPLGDDEIRRIVEGAFRPLRCVAEIRDYGQKLRFRVFDENDVGVLRMDSAVLRDLRDQQNLRNVLSAARETVEEKGFRLDPWSLPERRA